MTFSVGHTNGTDTDDHTTTYGSGGALVFVFLGFFLISIVAAMPYYLDETYYTPLSQRFVLVRGNKQGVVKVDAVPATPDLSQLSSRI